MRQAGGIDSGFLALETHDHPLHVMAVMMLDPTTVPGGYSFGGLSEFVADRLGGIPPFRQKLVPVPLGVGRPQWVNVEVDVNDHLYRVIFDGGGLPELAHFVADLEPAPLDRDVPLWSMHAVEGLDDGTVAVVAKVHHALMDGVGGMEFMASMFSLEPTPEPVVPLGHGEERTPPPWQRVVRAVPEVVSAPVRVARALMSSAHAVLRVGDALRTKQAIALPTSAPHMRWNDPIGPTRAIAFASLPLDDVKAVGRAVGVTVNDVVLAALGGACRSYLEARGELPDRALIAAVPVSVRAPNENVNTAANALTLMFASLGTDIADPRARVEAVHSSAHGAKNLQDAIGPDAFLQWLEAPSPLLIATVGRLYLGLHLAARAPAIVNLLVSNVAGPPMTLYFGGARLLALYPLGPVYDGVGLNITVVSSHETIGFGFVTCPDVISDIDALAAAVTHEFALLRDAVVAGRDIAKLTRLLGGRRHDPRPRLRLPARP